MISVVLIYAYRRSWSEPNFNVWFRS